MSSIALILRNKRLQEVTKLVSTELTVNVLFVCQRLMPYGRQNSEMAPKIPTPLMSTFCIIPSS